MVRHGRRFALLSSEGDPKRMWERSNQARFDRLRLAKRGHRLSLLTGKAMGTIRSILIALESALITLLTI